MAVDAVESGSPTVKALLVANILPLYPKNMNLRENKVPDMALTQEPPPQGVRHYISTIDTKLRTSETSHTWTITHPTDPKLTCSSPLVPLSGVIVTYWPMVEFGLSGTHVRIHILVSLGVRVHVRMTCVLKGSKGWMERVMVETKGRDIKESRIL
jgi:hypothetical protein